VKRSAARLCVEITDHSGRRVQRSGLEQWLQLVAPRSASGTITVALVSDARMRALNRRFRGVDRVTDVLSFPWGERDLRRSINTLETASSHLGDIAIATGRASRQAREAGHAKQVELRILVLHGLLHLLGYNHEHDSGLMARLEKECRLRGGLPVSLIEREGQRSL
jgi:probable rRNA maturation factor